MFDCIGLASKDIENSIEFYSLFDITFKEFGPYHFEAKTKSGVRLMLDGHKLLKEINPDWKETENPTTTLGFAKSKPSEVDILFNIIQKKGYRVIREPWDAFWGQRYASVLDPDGNQIDIFSPLDSE
jgi:uncharacterized glyoxalase superfamily protein PhnB